MTLSKGLHWGLLLAVTLASTNVLAENESSSPVTNRWGAAETLRIDTEEVIVQAAVTGRAYHHHCHTAALDGLFFAIFSSGEMNEDDVGQQVMFTRSDDDGVTWSAPRCIVTPPMGEFAPYAATATGLYAYHDPATGKGRLIAYYGLYEYTAEGLAGGVRKTTDASHQNTRCMLIYSDDKGATWSEPRLVAENVVANLGPQRTATGRLVMPANVVYLYTDDPTGLAGWVRTALPGVPEGHADDSAGFARLYREDPGRFGYCEGSLFQTDDQVLHMMLRTNRPHLAVTESTDNGATWSPARMTEFTDNASRHQFGKLPDGRYFALSTPEPNTLWSRTPLVIAVSRDGVEFDRHFIIGDAPNRPPKFPGHAKGGRYGYPHLSIMGDTVVVFYSIAKEDVAMCRFLLSKLQ